MHRYASVHGLPQLLDAIVERERAKTALPLERDNVLVAAGATGGLGAVAGAILEPGDEVLILAPYWPLIEGIVRSFHGAPVPVPVLAAGGRLRGRRGRSRGAPPHRAHGRALSVDPQQPERPPAAARLGRGARRAGRGGTTSG